jgi:hypothetical protein
MIQGDISPGLRAEQGDLGDAATFLAQAEEVAPALSHLLSASDRIDPDRALSLVAAFPLSRERVCMAPSRWPTPAVLPP